MNKASVDIHKQVLCEHVFLSLGGKYLGVSMLRHMVVCV